MPDLEKFSTCQGSAGYRLVQPDTGARQLGEDRWGAAVANGFRQAPGSGKGPEKGELSPGRKEAAG